MESKSTESTYIIYNEYREYYPKYSANSGTIFFTINNTVYTTTRLNNKVRTVNKSMQPWYYSSVIIIKQRVLSVLPNPFGDRYRDYGTALLVFHAYDAVLYNKVRTGNKRTYPH